MDKLRKKIVRIIAATLFCCNLMPVGTVWASTYEIKYGDTLQKIADSHEVTVEALQNANRLEGTLIYAGDILYIPDGIISYTVQAGDSLYKIAQRYQTTVEEIKSLNDLKTDVLWVGQYLQISGDSQRNNLNAGWRGAARNYTKEEWDMLAKVVYGEARGEVFTGQVAVAAVVLNRMDSAEFPNTMAEVIHQPGAFTCVSDGQYYLKPNSDAYLAARAALEGADPTWGCLYYWNPITATSQWIWTREIEMQIGNHVFGN